MKIQFIEGNNLKIKPNFNSLGFGKHFTDYMFEMEYSAEKGWHSPKIKPHSPILIDPAMCSLHYAQEAFEGLKAYKNKDNHILLFRPDMNAKRLQSSCSRLCMPELPEEIFLEAVKQLVKHEENWIPTTEGSSLYIRPFIFGSENFLGVRPANNYKFIVILSPVGAYYPEGINPVKIYVEDTYSRASKGGTGDIKCGGNYAASIIAQEKAHKLGYTQVLWLDSVEKKYVEEVGTMNVFFNIDDTIYTPMLNGTILPGITRDSCIELLKEWGYKVSESLIDIDSVMTAAKEGRLKEAWGTGTAAVISPIGELNYRGDIVKINNFKIGDVTKKLYDTLTGIQYGHINSKKNWSVLVK